MAEVCLECAQMCSLPRLPPLEPQPRLRRLDFPSQPIPGCRRPVPSSAACTTTASSVTTTTSDGGGSVPSLDAAPKGSSLKASTIYLNISHTLGFDATLLAAK